MKKTPENEEVKLPFTAIQSQIAFLQGKVLTIVEASFPQGTQLEAVKGLIKGAFRDQTDYIARLTWPEFPMFAQSELESMGVDVEKVTKTAVPLEEVE